MEDDNLILQCYRTTEWCEKDVNMQDCITEERLIMVSVPSCNKFTPCQHNHTITPL